MAILTLCALPHALCAMIPRFTHQFRHQLIT